MAIHAIGDRAVRHALDGIEAARAKGARFPRPPRIEHVQLCRAEDFARFRRLGVAASVQPVHLLTDRDVARRYWAARTDRSYAYRSLGRAGARLLSGSDAPFDRAGPLLGLHAAVHRRSPGEAGRHAFHPEQRLSLAAALAAHCEEPHRAAGWNEPLGRIASGYGADLAAFRCDVAALLLSPETGAREFERAVLPRATWLAGEIAVHVR